MKIWNGHSKQSWPAQRYIQTSAVNLYVTVLTASYVILESVAVKLP